MGHVERLELGLVSGVAEERRVDVETQERDVAVGGERRRGNGWRHCGCS